MYYIFKKGKIIEVSLQEWALWFQVFENRQIDRTEISDDVFVSTVFIGLDSNIIEEEWKNELPLLFETMVMGGQFSNCGWKYSTYGEAKKGHWYIVDCIRNGLKPAVPFGERPAIELFLEMFEEKNDVQQRPDGPVESDEPDEELG